MQARNHTIYIVTMRKESQLTDLLTKLSHKCRLVFTDLHAKQPFTFALGINIDVWIDDSPNFILNNARGCSTKPMEN